MDKCESIFTESLYPVDMWNKSHLQAKEAEKQKGKDERGKVKVKEKEKEKGEAAQAHHPQPTSQDKWASRKDFQKESCSKERFAQDVDNMDIGREVVQTLQISMHFLEELEKPLVCFALVSVRPSAVWNKGYVAQIRC